MNGPITGEQTSVSPSQMQISIETVSNGWMIRVMAKNGMSTSLVENIKGRDNIDYLLALCEALLRGES